MNTSARLPATLQDIDNCLPQTQCTMCGFPRCLDYAQAIFQGQTDINRCPPGGTPTAQRLANILELDVKPLAKDCDPYQGRKIARIQEEICIGCTLCISPCPVDAIIGASKHMHSVLSEDCTGCELCLEYCPVDCIEMVDSSPGVHGKFRTDFQDDEVSRWRNLADRHHERSKSDVRNFDCLMETTDLKSEIRYAVNRERSRRWKKARRAKAKLN